MSAESQYSPKVFCVGMNKTGTSTIKHCFERLGLFPIASPKTYSPEERREIRRFYEDKNYQAMLKLAENYRSFEDRPWNIWSMYRQLHERFPDSLFILTVRDPESWWRSTERWITITKPEVLPLYQLHLRVDQPTREPMIDSYQRYNREVIEYFAGTGRLLVMDIEKGDGWSKLCQFLAVPVPNVDFPHANRQRYTPEDAEILNSIRRAKHGVVCQACSHVTVVKKPSAGGGRAAGRGSPIALARKIKRKIEPEQLQNSPLVRTALYRLHRALRSMTPSNASQNQVRRAAAPRLLPSDELAVVSCLFNPGGSRQRVKNYRKFLAGIKASGVRCLVVEIAFGAAPFEITDHDDIIQLRSDSVLWHKERLLNIGIKRLLAEGVRKIAWLDGDIAFEDPEWPFEVASRLENANLCQVFDTIDIQAHRHGATMAAPSAVKYFLESGRLFEQSPRNLRNLLRGMLKGGQSGFGWAARAEVLEKALLFEYAVVGGADKLMLLASFADSLGDERFADLTRSKIACDACGHRNWSAALSESYMRWAHTWSDAVGGSLDYARLYIHDMYHGQRSDRGYTTRHDILYRHDFDPGMDLIQDNDGCLEWSGTKADLRREVEAYFLSRREDL